MGFFKRPRVFAAYLLLCAVGIIGLIYVGPVNVMVVGWMTGALKLLSAIAAVSGAVGALVEYLDPPIDTNHVDVSGA